MLLALEGIAGAGKSTLRDWLLSAATGRDIPMGHAGQFSWLSLPATRTLIALRSGRPAPTARQALAAAQRDLELHARHNLVPALARGPVIADRLILSTAALLALVHEGAWSAATCGSSPKSTAARPDLTVLITTPPEVCHGRLADRETARRFGEDQKTNARLADLYAQAATAWTATTGCPVLRHPCSTGADLSTLGSACLARIGTTATPAARSRGTIMNLDPLHPAAWVTGQVSAAGWDVRDLLAFTRASTLMLASRSGEPPVVIKAGLAATTSSPSSTTAPGRRPTGSTGTPR